MEELVINERELRHAQYLKAHNVPFPEAWYNHNAFLSLFFAAASVAIPEAERMVVKTVEEVIAGREFPKLHDEIVTIMHEETAHSRVHDAFNIYLKTLGLPVEKHLEASRNIMKFLHSHFSLRTRLAMCAALEHFTASGARQVLDNGVFEGKGGIYRNLLRDWVRFFKPGFHPSQIPIRNSLQKQLHHYHIESELIGYFAPNNA